MAQIYRRNKKNGHDYYRSAQNGRADMTICQCGAKSLWEKMTIHSTKVQFPVLAPYPAMLYKQKRYNESGLLHVQCILTILFKLLMYNLRHFYS